MKIICIGRNYSAHISELGNELPESPVIFMKPETALLRENKPFYIPEWTQDVHYEAELVFRIGKNGKYIAEKHAFSYVSHYTLGVDFTARDRQSYLKEKRLPWELSKAFDGSAVIGELQQVTTKLPLYLPGLDFSMELNGKEVQQGNPDQMIYSLEKIIAFVSQYFTLKIGDLIFTGTPEGVGKVSAGDVLRGSISAREMFNFKIK